MFMSRSVANLRLADERSSDDARLSLGNILTHTHTRTRQHWCARGPAAQWLGHGNVMLSYAP